MEVIIAGDVIGSKKNDPQEFLTIIKPILQKYCKPDMYQLYRGDSFQGWLETPELGVYVCILLKAALRASGKTGKLDVRMALGLGSVNLIDNNIALSTGTALTYSGELLDILKEKEQNLMVKSGHALDHYMNTALKMGLLYMDKWTANAAAIVYALMANPSMTQEDLGNKLGIQQATASRRLARAHWKETIQLSNLFKHYHKDLSHAHRT